MSGYMMGKLDESDLVHFSISEEDGETLLGVIHEIKKIEIHKKEYEED